MELWRDKGTRTGGRRDRNKTRFQFFFVVHVWLCAWDFLAVLMNFVLHVSKHVSDRRNNNNIRCEMNKLNKTDPNDNWSRLNSILFLIQYARKILFQPYSKTGQRCTRSRHQFLMPKFPPCLESKLRFQLCYGRIEEHRL